jgi:hypothetical protein
MASATFSVASVQIAMTVQGRDHRFQAYCAFTISAFESFAHPDGLSLKSRTLWL